MARQTPFDSNKQSDIDRSNSGQNSADKTIRVLMAKAGLDGHDRGAKVVARALEDVGVTVIYTGLHQTPKEIAAAAIEHKVGAIGISVLSGAHLTVFPEVINFLAELQAPEILVFGGGVIPADDIPELLASGVKIIFTPGTALSTVANWVIENLR